MIQSIFIGIALIASLFGLARTPVSTLDYDWKNPPLFFGAVSYPASLDVFENPTAGQSVATVVTHSTQHSNANDALEALEAKIGINVSTPVTDSIFVGTSAGGSQWSTYATGTSAYFTNYLATGSTTLQNFTGLQSTTTSATTTNSFATTASSTNLFFTTGIGGNFTSSGAGEFSNLLSRASSTFHNVTFLNSTSTNATTTAFFATTASSTSLTALTGRINTLTVTSCTGCGQTQTVTSLVPLPDFFAFRVGAGGGFVTNTLLHLGRYVIPLTITVNKVSIYGTELDVAGNFDITLFSEDGQTQIFNISNLAGAADVMTATLGAPVTIDPGIYYFGVLPNSTADTKIVHYITADAAGTDLGATLFGGVASEPDRKGTITVTADTMPATIDPTAITHAAESAAVFRLD